MGEKKNSIPVPSEFKLQRNDPFYKEIISRHETAYRNGEITYIDPKTGLTVFTALYHQKRGYCCGSGCRHCPYDE